MLRTCQNKSFVWLLMPTTNSGSECWGVRQEANQVVFGHPRQSDCHIDNKIDPKQHPISCPNTDPKPVVEYLVFPCVLHANQHLLRREKVAMGADLRRGKKLLWELVCASQVPLFLCCGIWQPSCPQSDSCPMHSPPMPVYMPSPNIPS